MTNILLTGGRAPVALDLARAFHDLVLQDRVEREALGGEAGARDRHLRAVHRLEGVERERQIGRAHV